MARSHIAYRVGVRLWMEDGAFDVFFSKLRCQDLDEIAFFTSETHAPLPMEEMERRIAILQRRVAVCRAAGFLAGINHLPTVGHHEEHLDGSLQGNYQHVTDSQGRVSLGSYCMNDERYLAEYVEPLYRKMAAADPDFIWIDDDVRQMGHMPIGETCLCDHCVALFSARIGRLYTRESLVAAFDTGDDDALALRRQWLAFNRQTIANLLHRIERATHSVRPDLPLGMMTGERYYEGYEFDRWERELSGPDGAEVMWRPGGGFYREDTPRGMTQKAHQVGRQIAYLSPNVTRIESEIENFPYQRLLKSKRITGVEAACHIAAGCTGAAFNVLCLTDEYLSDYEGQDFVTLTQDLSSHRFFFDAMVDAMGRTAPVGVYTGWTQDSFVAAGWDEKKWFGGSWPPVGQHMEEMYAIGLPAAYHPDHGLVTALSGTAVLAMTEEQIVAMLKKGVYMDGDALRHLTNRGYGALCGFTITDVRRKDCLERMSDDALNGPAVGSLRDCRQSFWKIPAFELVPMAGARVLARIEDYFGQVSAPCMGVYENELGGRVCVAGYAPWDLLYSRAKTDQLKNIFAWLAGQPMGFVESYHKIEMWIRGGQDGPAALVNMFHDDAVDVDVVLPSTRATRQLLTYEGETMALQGEAAGPGLLRYRIPRILPFGIVLIR